MKLISIELKNIGLYKNQLINFENTQDKNVSVFWGNNGAGKTTLLNSIKLGLLGNKAFSYSLDEYCKFIRESIVSSRCELTRNKAFIKISFSLKENNKINNYSIKREWKIKNSALEENVSCYLNNEILDFLNQDNLLNKVYTILPPTLLDVIIFDGENAINILNNNEMHKLIKNIVYAVFGMDVYANLIKDLNIYLRHMKSTNNNSSKDDLTLMMYENKFRKCLGEFNENKLKIETIKKTNQSLLNSLSFKLKKLSQTTGVEFSDISTFKKDFADIKGNKKILDEEIKHINEEILPLKMLHSKIKKLIKDIELEKPYLIMNNIKTLSKYFENDSSALKLLTELKLKIGNVDGEIKFNLNELETKIITDIDTLLDTYTIEKLNSYYIEKNNAFTELKEKVEAVTKLEDDESKNLMDSIEEIYNQLDSIQSELGLLNEENVSLSFNLAESKINYDSIKKEIINKKKESNAYVNVMLYKEAIEEFFNENINDICKNLDQKIFSELRRIKFRNNSITGVEINPKNFEIKLYEEGRKIIQSKLFSAGEKQILLGLTIKESLELSKIDTFFLFDTPVGRLDMLNRDIFTKEVILNVSDQVAIFATDSDYSTVEYDKLKNYLTTEYKLLRNKDDEIVVKKGSIY